MKVRKIADVAAWQLCSGCGACAYMCPEQIEMQDVLDHGRRPRIKDETAAGADSSAMKVCPGAVLARPSQPESQKGGKAVFQTWGPVLEVWEGAANDREVWFKGSSGGVASALSIFAIQELGMAGTLHIQSRLDEPYLNETVLSTTREAVLAGAGSRYAPASPCDGLTQIEKASAPCVFIGKPCDVAALHRAAELRPELRQNLGLSIAFFCAGSPTTAGTLDMLRQMGMRDSDTLHALRYRGHGWPGRATASFKNADNTMQTRELTYEESWGGILQKYRQWRCYICPDHIGEHADIAVADAWHCSRAENQPGRSLIIARTPRGKDIMEKAIEFGVVNVCAVSTDTLPLCRPVQAALQGQLWGRLITLSAFGVPVPRYKGYFLFSHWLSELTFTQNIHSILSTIKRIVVKKLRQPRRLEFHHGPFLSRRRDD